MKSKWKSFVKEYIEKRLGWFNNHKQESVEAF